MHVVFLLEPTVYSALVGVWFKTEQSLPLATPNVTGNSEVAEATTVKLLPYAAVAGGAVLTVMDSDIGLTT